MTATHEVTNQVPPLLGHDVLGVDAALQEALARHGDPSEKTLERLHALGRLAGSEQASEWATQANESTPQLRTHDRYGHRVDEVEFHPAWHRLMDVAVTHGLHAAPWTSDEPRAHAVRAAAYLVWGQVEPGHLCPITMTYAAVPPLRRDDALAGEWVPRLASSAYDFGLRPAAEKAGVIAGMGMTEKQGGSDVRANTTRAVDAGDGTFRLTGHKWFVSAPMSDVFLVTAQAEGGLTCFVLPRVLPDGTRNPFRLQRLKDKLGNRSNASSEVEFDATVAWQLGEQGRGVRTIIEMVAATRLDTVLGSAATMRAAVSQATWHAAHRSAFGGLLAQQPLMTNVLADLAVEAEAAMLLGMRLAAAVDAGEDAQEQALRRIGVAIGKYWVCKRTAPLTEEALECLGGNGYVEESGMPRLYREAPVNSVWEGSGNVVALDVLRALGRTPEALDAWLGEVGQARGADARFDAAVTDTLDTLAGLGADAASAQRGARRLVEKMALLLQGSLVLRYSPPAVADAFCASRLGRDAGLAFGTLPAGVDTAAIVARATPEVG